MNCIPVKSRREFKSIHTYTVLNTQALSFVKDHIVQNYLNRAFWSETTGLYLKGRAFRLSKLIIRADQVSLNQPWGLGTGAAGSASNDALSLSLPLFS